MDNKLRKPRTRLKKVMNKENYNLNKISTYKKRELYDLLREERAVNIHFKGILEQIKETSNFLIQKAQNKVKAHEGKHRFWQVLAIILFAITFATLVSHK
jgi:hypothetical protein